MPLDPIPFSLFLIKFLPSILYSICFFISLSSSSINRKDLKQPNTVVITPTATLPHKFFFNLIINFSLERVYLGSIREIIKDMSSIDAAAAASEQLCYIPCNFCNIVLAVSVPCSSLFDIVTVRCGHCTNLWSVNMGMAAAFHHSLSNSNSNSQDSTNHAQKAPTHTPPNYRVDLGSSSKYNSRMPMRPSAVSVTNDQKINRAPEKRQRVPSAYNQFIKEEIQRIKTNNPDISHREAFSTAAKNWAHFPHIHFGLMLEANNHQAKLDELSSVQGSEKRLRSRASLFKK